MSQTSKQAIPHKYSWNCQKGRNIFNFGAKIVNFGAKRAQLQKPAIHSKQLPVKCPKNNTGEMSPLFLHFWQIRWRLCQHHPCPDWPLPSHVWSGTPGMGGGVAVETGWAILGRKCQRILHIGRRYLIVITYAFSNASRLHMIQEWWIILSWVLNWPPLGLSFMVYLPDILLI